MIRLDASNAELLVFTEKEGLLSPVAHDLELRASQFSLDVDPAAGRVTGTIDASSLQVVCAMKSGVADLRALSDKDKREIEGNIRKDVLGANRHPEIRVSAEDLPQSGRGRARVTLAGREREVAVELRVDGEWLRAQVVLHQPDFGIKPYSAMLGTLKVKADVRVVLSVRAALLG